MIEITVNNETQHIASHSTLADVLHTLNLPEKGIAVAHNAEVVRRAQWAQTVLQNGDRIDVIRAVQGG